MYRKNMIDIKKTKWRSIQAITDNKICCGCGACKVICTTSAISFIFGTRFNYPKIDKTKCINCKKCLEVCPSSFLLKGTMPEITYEPAPSGTTAYLIHSSDAHIRHEAASGGFITSLLIYLLENGTINGSIVARCEGKNPLIAESFIARDKRSIISACGSKYAPVSNLIVLRDILKGSGRYAFVGTPCMLEGLVRLERYFPELRQKIVLKVGIVCAGMASRLSTKNYIEQDGKVAISDVRKICYRGDGWPGRFRVFGEGGAILMDRPLIGGSLIHVVGVDHYLRCENCLDHWANFADIAVSDPWSEEMIGSEREGRSAILVKRKAGHDTVSAGVNAGYFISDPILPEKMIGFNKHLFITKNHVRHCWMALYQIVFMHRIKYLFPLVQFMLKGNVCGAITTIKARFSKRYYY